MSLISKLEQDPNLRQNALVLLRKAEDKAISGNLLDAEEYLMQAIQAFEFSGGKLDPKHAEALIRLADVIEAQGRDAYSLRSIGLVLLKLAS